MPCGAQAPLMQIPPLLPGAIEPSAPSRPEAGEIAEVSRQSPVRKDLEKRRVWGYLCYHCILCSWITVSGTHISCLCVCGIFNTKRQLTRELPGQGVTAACGLVLH